MRATFQLVAANGIIGGGNFWLYVWVTEPERLKGAKDKDVKFFECLTVYLPVWSLWLCKHNCRYHM